MFIYISGKITDTSKAKEKENLKRFDEAAVRLRKEGHQVFNPAEHESPGKTWEQYLARDLLWITLNCHRPLTLWMIRGWKSSRGARLEREIAKLLRLKIIYEEE